MSGETRRESSDKRIESVDPAELARQLKHAQSRNKLLSASTGVLAVVVVLTLFWFFHYFIWSYAVIDELKIEQNPQNPRQAMFQFSVVKGGFLRYGYDKAVLAENVATGEKKKFFWQWALTPDQREFSAFVRSRWSVFPSRTTQTFQVTPAK